MQILSNNHIHYSLFIYILRHGFKIGSNVENRLKFTSSKCLKKKNKKFKCFLMLKFKHFELKRLSADENV